MLSLDHDLGWQLLGCEPEHLLRLNIWGLGLCLPDDCVLFLSENLRCGLVKLIIEMSVTHSR